MGPQEPKDVTTDIARALTGMAGELAALKVDARQWLTDQEHAELQLRLALAPVAGAVVGYLIGAKIGWWW